jgi:WhiB family redox-sensing transcriptional regulator
MTTNNEHLIDLPNFGEPEKDPSWRKNSRCFGSDPETFYPSKGGNVAKAKLTCFGCPVRKRCHEFAMEHHMRYGIFGGFSEPDRKQIRAGHMSDVLTLKDVLHYAFYEITNSYPRKDDKRWRQFKPAIIKSASRSLSVPVTTIRDNFDFADDYVI